MIIRMSFRVYLVEDNIELGRLLETYLQREEYQTKRFETGEGALGAIEEKPDAWVLDIMLPDIDGFYIIRQIKQKTPEVPVIFISARDKELDRVLGLEMGSDDYITKPFLPRELVIRVKRLLDRTYGAASQGRGKVYMVDGYRIDEEKRSVTDSGREIVLTAKEADLALVFASHAGRPLSRDTLLSLVWDEGYFGSDRVVDDLVRRLRQKLPRLNIETVYGQGYRLIV
jgi:two-component system response regulator CssR